MIIDGIDLSRWLVSNHKRPVLPSISISRQQVPGMDGDVWSTVTLESVSIPVECHLAPEVRWPHPQARASLEELKRILASFLFKRGKREIIFDGDETRYFLGMLEGVDGFGQIGVSERFTMNLLCEPVAYGQERFVPLRSGANTVDNPGTYKALPVFELVSTGTVPYMRITDTGTGELIQVDAAFRAGTALVMDSSAKKATVNGNNVPVTTSSDFFVLHPGQTALSLSSGSGTVRYKERWL